MPTATIRSVACLRALPAAGSEVPTCIVAHTVKGKGVRYMELSRTWHLGYLGPEDERAATL